MQNDFLAQFRSGTASCGVQASQSSARNAYSADELVQALQEQLFAEKREIEHLRLENQRLAEKVTQIYTQHVENAGNPVDFEVLSARAENESLKGKLNAAMREIAMLEREPSEATYETLKRENMALRRETERMSDELLQARVALEESRKNSWLTETRLRAQGEQCSEVEALATEMIEKTREYAAQIQERLGVRVPARSTAELDLIWRVLDQFGARLFGSSWAVENTAEE